MYYKNATNNPCKTAINNIFSSLIKHKAHFTEHRDQLSTVMKQYEILTYVGRMHPENYLSEWDNPKDPLSEIKDMKFQGLAWSAWSYWVQELSQQRRVGLQVPLPLQGKINKTFDEYVALKLNPKYSFKVFFKEKEAVYNYLFTLLGTGVTWNEEGFLVEAESLWGFPAELSGEVKDVLSFKDEEWYKIGFDIFFKDFSKGHDKLAFKLENIMYQENPESVMENIISNVKDMGKLTPEIETYLRGHLDVIATLNSAYLLRQDVCSGVNLLTMPDNAHPSYKAAALDWAKILLEKKKSDPKSLQLLKAFIKKHQD